MGNMYEVGKCLMGFIRTTAEESEAVDKILDEGITVGSRIHGTSFEYCGETEYGYKLRNVFTGIVTVA